VADPAAGVLTLYGRRYCHLCDDMAAALAPLAAEHRMTVVFVDVDTDAALEGHFGERVPVLAHGERELCHYFLDAGRVRTYLAEIRQGGAEVPRHSRASGNPP